MRVFAHGWLLTDGEKMSKSQGNVVDPFNLVDQFGADAVRYFLFREAPFGSDFSISFENSGCATTPISARSRKFIGRSLAMLTKYRTARARSKRVDARRPLRRYRSGSPRARDGMRFREALDTIWGLITALNREIDDRKPWDLYKHDRGVELDALLYDLCEGLRFVAILIYPFMRRRQRDVAAARLPETRTCAGRKLRWEASPPTRKPHQATHCFRV